MYIDLQYWKRQQSSVSSQRVRHALIDTDAVKAAMMAKTKGKCIVRCDTGSINNLKSSRYWKRKWYGHPIAVQYKPIDHGTTSTVIAYCSTFGRAPAGSVYPLGRSYRQLALTSPRRRSYTYFLAVSNMRSEGKLLVRDVKTDEADFKDRQSSMYSA
ncbi:hypothetical protein BD769DRAFT_1387384 [Suillus cothurnatus]|nr:hypothetical protein BD769DRAFT_1387384 [Suillus cothurnatus]